MYRESSNVSPFSTFIQVTSDSNNIAFEDTLNSIYEQSTTTDLHFHFRDSEGYIEKDDLNLYVDEDTEIYICGGNSFINSMVLSLQELEVPEERIHFETFIPRLSFSV